MSESRPYYECRTRVAELQKKCQLAVQSYERSVELHSQSKETITIAESKFAVNKDNGSDFDHFWQEMLNQANTKVSQTIKNLIVIVILIAFVLHCLISSWRLRT